MTVRRRARILPLAAGATVLIATTAIAATVAFAPTPREVPRRTKVPATSVTVSNQASEATIALGQLTTHPERLVPDSLRATVDPTIAVPNGTKVSPREETWVSTGPRSGTIQVELTDPQGTKSLYLAVMVEEAGSWRVLGTEPLQ